MDALSTTLQSSLGRKGSMMLRISNSRHFLQFRLQRTMYWLRHRFWFGGSGISLQTYLWIRRNIERGGSIVELGGGLVSTRLLHKRFRLFTIESDTKYLNLFNSTYIHAPIDESGWFNQAAITEAGLPLEMDLLIVDGPPGHVGRQGIIQFHNCLPKVKFILVDDTDRQPEFRLSVELAAKLDGSLAHFANFSLITLKAS